MLHCNKKAAVIGAVAITPASRTEADERHDFCVFSVLTTLVLAIISLRYVTDFYLLSFFYSFQLHLAAAAALASLAALLVKRHWYGLLTLGISLALAVHGIVMTREFAQSAVDEHRPVLFRLMSFNIENDNFANGAAIADMAIASGATSSTSSRPSRFSRNCRGF